MKQVSATPGVAELRSILAQSATSTLGITAEQFEAVFSQPGQRFRALCTLIFWSEQKAIPSLAERVVAYFLVACPYDWTNLETFPFLEFFVQVAGCNTQPRADRALMQALLNKGPNALKDSNPTQLADRLSTEPATLQSLESLAAKYSVDIDILTSHNATSEPSITPTQNTSSIGTGTGSDLSDQHGPPALLVTPEKDNQLLRRFPAITSPAGGLDEVDGLQDSGVTHAALDQLRKLLSDAQARPLAPAPQKDFLHALETWPQVIKHLGLSPSQLPALVEHNNMIAVELLLKLIDTKSGKVDEFLDVLVVMDLSVHSMEVVKRLTNVASLPPDFIQLYITSCIHSCETMEPNSFQNRLVRLVCVFLQSLIRTKIIDVTAVQHEVLSFCVVFSRIREAASLFRLLQSFQEQSGDVMTPQILLPSAQV